MIEMKLEPISSQRVGCDMSGVMKKPWVPLGLNQEEAIINTIVTAE